MNITLFAEWVLMALLLLQLMVAVTTTCLALNINKPVGILMALSSLYIAFVFIKIIYGDYNLLTFTINKGLVAPLVLCRFSITVYKEVSM